MSKKTYVLLCLFGLAPLPAAAEEPPIKAEVEVTLLTPGEVSAICSFLPTAPYRDVCVFAAGPKTSRTCTLILSVFTTDPKSFAERVYNELLYCLDQPSRLSP